MKHLWNCDLWVVIFFFWNYGIFRKEQSNIVKNCVASGPQSVSVQAQAYGKEKETWVKPPGSHCTITKHISSIAQLYSHARNPQPDSVIVRSWSQHLPIWWEVYTCHCFCMAFKSVGSALRCQLPQYKKPIYRAGNWQEVKDIKSLLTALIKVRANDYGFGFTREPNGYYGEGKVIRF